MTRNQALGPRLRHIYTLENQVAATIQTSRLRDSSGRFTKGTPVTKQHDTATPSYTSTTRPVSRLSDFEFISTSRPDTPFKITPSTSPTKHTFATTAKTTPPQSAETMASEQVAPFHGDKDDENPEDFLRSFFRRMGTSTDEVRKQQFPNFLQADSVADEWFEELAGNEKESWAKIETAFRARWPRKKAAKKTNEEYEEEVRGLELKMEELGKKEKIAGRDVYTHIAWAEKMGTIVRGAKLENTTTHIGHVRKNLPTLLREKLGAGHTNWTTFLKAVREMDIDHIRDGVDIWKKEQAKEEAVRKRIGELEKLITTSPTAPIRQQMSTFNIGNQPAPAPVFQQATGTAANPFTANSGGRGNLFTQPRGGAPNYAPRPPPTPADRAAIQIQLTKYPQHPDTEAGRKAHQGQQADWMKTYGPGTRVTESTPYPLRPGTAPANAGECFTCGFTGHFGRRDGSTCGGNRPLHPNEQAWRSICSRILKEPKQTANIHLVTIDDYGTVWQDVQGNEEGSSV